jgi:hypothetical protein
LAGENYFAEAYFGEETLDPVPAVALDETGRFVPFGASVLAEDGERVVGTVLTETGARVVGLSIVNQIICVGIPSAEAFGSCNTGIHLIGMASVGAFGTPKIQVGIRCFGIPTQEKEGRASSVNPQTINLNSGQNVWGTEFSWSNAGLWSGTLANGGASREPGFAKFGTDELGSPWYYFVIQGPTANPRVSLVRVSANHPPAIIDDQIAPNGNWSSFVGGPVVVSDGVLWCITYTNVSNQEVNIYRLWNGTTASAKWTVTQSSSLPQVYSLFYGPTRGYVYSEYQIAFGAGTITWRHIAWKYDGSDGGPSNPPFVTDVTGGSAPVDVHWSELDGRVWHGSDILSFNVDGINDYAGFGPTAAGSPGSIVKLLLGGSAYYFWGIDRQGNPGRNDYWVQSSKTMQRWSDGPGEYTAGGWKLAGCKNMAWIALGTPRQFSGLTDGFPASTGNTPSVLALLYTDFREGNPDSGFLWALSPNPDANTAFITKAPALRYGIASAEKFGLISKINFTIRMTALPPPPTDTGVIHYGIATKEAFGLAAVNLPPPNSRQFGPTGIPSAQVFGVPKLNMNIKPVGIPSTEAFGTVRGPLVTIDFPLGGGGLTAEAFGTPRLVLYIKPNGMSSGAAFGTSGLGLLPAEFSVTGLQRYMIVVDFGGPNQVVLECLPFEWPISRWQTLELSFTAETGWNRLDSTAYQRLLNIYNGARGAVESGMSGLIAQYFPGTGQANSVLVMDWRKNSGRFVFHPNDGFTREKIHEIQSEAHYTGRLALVKVG